MLLVATPAPGRLARRNKRALAGAINRRSAVQFVAAAAAAAKVCSWPSDKGAADTSLASFILHPERGRDRGQDMYQTPVSNISSLSSSFLLGSVPVPFRDLIFIFQLFHCARARRRDGRRKIQSPDRPPALNPWYANQFFFFSCRARRRSSSRSFHLCWLPRAAGA